MRMKKNYLILIISILSLNLALAQTKAKLDFDSIQKKIEFKIEFFDLKTNNKIQHLSIDKSIDSIGIRYLLVLPDIIGVQNYLIKNENKLVDFEFKKLRLGKFKQVWDPKNKTRVVCVSKGILIPKRRGNLKIKPKKIVLQIKMPTGRKDFLGTPIYESKLTSFKFKSKKLKFEFK